MGNNDMKRGTMFDLVGKVFGGVRGAVFKKSAPWSPKAEN